MADLIIFIGSDFPFAAYFFNLDANFIQIYTDASKFGCCHKTNLTILGDARIPLRCLTELG